MAALYSMTLQERMNTINNAEHGLTDGLTEYTFQEACNRWLKETGTINGVDYSSIGFNRYTPQEAFAIIRHKDDLYSETLTELINELGPYNANEYTPTEALNKKNAVLVPYSLSFDGLNDYVAIADTSELSFGNGTVDSAFSISAWIYVVDATTFRIIGKCAHDSGGMEWAFLTDSADDLRLVLYDATTSHYISQKADVVFPENQWVHVACTYNASGAASGIILYQDGVVSASTAVDIGSYTALHSTSAAIEMGRLRYSSATTDYSDGKIDEVSIFDKVLTPAEVTSLYAANPQNAGDAVGITNLTGYWKMDHGSGPVARDVSVVETLGNESLSNPSFSDGTFTSWTLGGPPDTYEVVSHDGHATAAHIVTSSANNGPYETSIVTAGKLYKVSFDIKVISGNVYLGKSASKVGGVNYTDSSWTSYTHYWIAEDSHFRAYNAIASSEFYIDNISVKEVTNGNHGTINGATWTVH
tara:strand:+ start:900 stop:2318 length:1419 start_codon:yes stop_codon:yes gene_type:complete